MPAQQASAAYARRAVSRSQLASALLIIASANGMLPRAITSVTANGWVYGLSNTFDISSIVWAAWVSACYLTLQPTDAEPVRRIDLIFAFVALAFVAIPVSSVSWVSLSLLSAYIFWSSPRHSSLRRSAAIFFAICVPMFWGPLFLTLAAGPLLQIDAFFVSLLLGTERVGNFVRFADGIHNLQIWAPCSSFHNISQAAVAWVALSQTLGRAWGLREVMWCALAIASAVAVNLVRLSLMGINFEYYTIVHGPIGQQVGGGLTLVLIILVCTVGLRRELFARA